MVCSYWRNRYCRVYYYRDTITGTPLKCYYVITSTLHSKKALSIMDHESTFHVLPLDCNVTIHVGLNKNCFEQEITYCIMSNQQKFTTKTKVRWPVS